MRPGDGRAALDEAASFVRQLLDPNGERTAPAGLSWPDTNPKPRRMYGLCGPHRPFEQLARLGRIPDVGDDLVVDGWRLTVVRRDHNRVDVRADSRRRTLHVRLHRLLYNA